VNVVGGVPFPGVRSVVVCIIFGRAGESGVLEVPCSSAVCFV
jgi:hypothetical protein